MILGLASILISGLVAYAMLIAFLALAPRVAAGRSSIRSSSVQWLLVAALVLPAIAVAYFGPSWLFDVPFGQAATKDQRFWLIVGGIALLIICFLVALRSSAGKRYSQWRAGSPNTSLERTRDR